MITQCCINHKGLNDLICSERIFKYTTRKDRKSGTYLFTLYAEYKSVGVRMFWIFIRDIDKVEMNYDEYLECCLNAIIREFVSYDDGIRRLENE